MLERRERLVQLIGILTGISRLPDGYSRMLIVAASRHHVFVAIRFAMSIIATIAYHATIAFPESPPVMSFPRRVARRTTRCVSQHLALAVLVGLVGLVFVESSHAQINTLATWTGDSAKDEFGRSVAGAGDLDGDGIADVVIGAGDDDNNGMNSGNARVLSGVDGSIIFSFDGSGPNAQAGFSVDAGHDVNGDGIGDIVVGARFDASTTFEAGRATVYSGVDGSEIFHVDGTATGDRLGWTVAFLDDVDNDGRADIAIGSPYHDTAAQTAGRVTVVSGATGSVIYVIDGVASGDRFGLALAAAGDVNGDGVTDIVIGAPDHEANGHGAGMARVHSGVDGSLVHEFLGASAGDRFGLTVAGGGDFNGDGTDDVIVGAPWSQSAGFATGAAFVYSGVDGSELFARTGESSGDEWGCTVALGDMTGDGIAEAIVGAPGHDFDGSMILGLVRSYSGPTGAIVGEWFGATSAERFGSALAVVGDVDLDGRSDLAIGAYLGDTGAFDGGTTTVVGIGPARRALRQVAVDVPSTTSTTAVTLFNPALRPVFGFALEFGAGGGSNLIAVDVTSSELVGDWDVDDDGDGISNSGLDDTDDVLATPSLTTVIDAFGIGDEAAPADVAGMAMKPATCVAVNVDFVAPTASDDHLELLAIGRRGLPLTTTPTQSLFSGSNFVMLDVNDTLTAGFSAAFRNAAGGNIVGLEVTTDGQTTVTQMFEVDPSVDVDLSATSIGSSVTKTITLTQPVTPGGIVACDVLFFGTTPDTSQSVTVTPMIQPVAARPGTGEDLVFGSGVGAGPVTSGPGEDIKIVSTGSPMTIEFSSPGGSFVGIATFLAAQAYSTGAPSPIVFGLPTLHLDPNRLPSPLVLFDIVLPPTGMTLPFVVPSNLAGISFNLQAVTVTPIAANGFFASTDAHELRIVP